MRTAGDLRDYADTCLFDGDYLRALYAYSALIQFQPNALDARLRTADTLLAMGEVPAAGIVYFSLARHCANAGFPLRSLIAIKLLETLEPNLTELLDSFAALYCCDSTRLGRAVRLSLGDRTQELPPDWELGDPPEAADLLQKAATLAASMEQIATYPEQLPPIPLFSQLPPDTFARVLKALRLVRKRAGKLILEQGEEGTSFFVLARGRAEVIRVEGETSTTLATLQDGALFGEMALVSAQTRSASVRAVSDCDLFEFDRGALRAAASEMSTIASALDRFTRERMLENLMATSPFFAPLERKARRDLMRRFDAYDITAGTPAIREGEVGKGLYVVLSGTMAVMKQDGSEYLKLATLAPGDVFGEMSLLYEEPTSASVIAETQSTVMFLSRGLFHTLVDAVEEVRQYVESLGEERTMDTQIALRARLDDEVDVDVSDFVVV